MALARVKTWAAGDVLTAADLNAEFNNVLNNPIALISPLTGNVNANNKTISNLPLANVTSTTIATGDMLVGSTGTWATRVTGNPGEYLIISTNSIMQWGSLAKHADFVSLERVQDDFNRFSGPGSGNGELYYGNSSGTAQLSSAFGNIASVVGFPDAGATAGTVLRTGSSGSTGVAHFYSTNSFDYCAVVARANNSSGVIRIGLGATDSAWAVDPPTTYGIFFQTTTTSSQALWTARAVVGGGTPAGTITTTAQASTGTFNTLRLVMTSSGGCTVQTNGVTAGTFTTSQVTTAGLNFAVGTSAALANTYIIDGWRCVQNRSTALGVTPL